MLVVTSFLRDKGKKHIYSDVFQPVRPYKVKGNIVPLYLTLHVRGVDRASGMSMLKSIFCFVDCIHRQFSPDCAERTVFICLISCCGRLDLLLENYEEGTHLVSHWICNKSSRIGAHPPQDNSNSVSVVRHTHQKPLTHLRQPEGSTVLLGYQADV